ncbi:glycosyltransferase family 4 protein [Sphingomonas profundi]|uniref:glycosyltransferase family 4 protein n=1 Tax=Alterirhizorhabdus profundi TaxID=2681549 RepID=UPI0012E911CA|nr:glycosyltransferase family 1 protein [Sphingomonas profundi]
MDRTIDFVSTNEGAGARADPEAAIRKLDGADIILFSVQDLFGYLKAHATMSGIQRVQAGIALYAIEHEDERVGFILNDLSDKYRDGEFLLIDNAAFREVIAYASGERVDHEHLRGMLARCEAEAHVIRPRPANTIILLGAFWGHGNTMDRYVTAKRDGVKLGAYVYDIIPVTHPEYCDADLVRDFSMSVGEMGLVVDFVFTISDYTRETLARLFRENGGRDIPMRTVPLAHSLTVPDISVESWPAALRKIKGRPYVAYVSTVEGRKNHLYVVNAWRQMIDQGVDVPDLVFVGRRGWRISGLMDLLDGTNYLDGRVHIVHDLSDSELNSIYANCRFTVFTSFVEGWGLPVGESLIHHVPCAASRTSSLPEVGGVFVDYLDPLNLRQGVVVLRKLIEDHDYREARRQQIREHFVPRSWDDVGRDFIEKVREEIATGYPARTIHPPLPQGVKFTLGDLVSRPILMHDYVPSPMRLALVGSFYHLERFGAWMRGNVGEFTFQTDLPAGEEVVVYAELEVRDKATGRDISITVADAGGEAPPRWQTIADTGQRLYRTRGKVGEGGLCTIVLEVSGTLNAVEFDSRLFAIGLAAIGYARATDSALREDLVERFTFQDMSRGGRGR